MQKQLNNIPLILAPDCSGRMSDVVSRECKSQLQEIANLMNGMLKDTSTPRKTIIISDNDNPC